MGVIGSASDLAARYDERLKKVRNLVAVAERQTARDAKVAAVKLSSGSLTYADLRRRGYPYATRNPTSPNPEVLNQHDGSVAGGWTITFTSSPRETRVDVTNSSPWITMLLGGTPFTVPRRIDQGILRAVAATRLKRLVATKSAALD